MTNPLPKEMQDQMREFLSDEDFNKELQTIVDIEIKNASDGDTDSVMPKLVAVCSKSGKPDGELEKAIVVMAIDDFNEHEVKYRTFQGLGAKFADEGYNVIAAFQISEAWVSTQVSEDGEPKYNKPSEDPNRQEVIVVAGLTIDRRTNFASIPFKRIKKGKKEVMMTMTPQVISYDEKADQQFQANLLDDFFRFYLLGMATKMAKKLGVDPRSFFQKQKEGGSEKHSN